MKFLQIILIVMIMATISFAEHVSETENFNPNSVPNVSTLKFDINGSISNRFTLLEFNKESQNCSKYLGRGYCTDWVYKRLGVRQRGNANQWQGNIPINKGRAGDVGVQLIGSFGHVFVIEGPSYKPYTAILNGYVISEMNFGSKMVNAGCGVTNLFGIQTKRIIPLNQVARIWRP